MSRGRSSTAAVLGRDSFRRLPPVHAGSFGLYWRPLWPTSKTRCNVVATEHTRDAGEGQTTKVWWAKDSVPYQNNGSSTWVSLRMPILYIILYVPNVRQSHTSILNP